MDSLETFALVILLAVLVIIAKELFFSRLAEIGKKINPSASRRDELEEEKYFIVDAVEEDFFGDNLAKNDPAKFHANVVEKRKKLDEGKIIGVNAAEAFYLIRNQRQQNLLVSEDGIMHWRDLQSAELRFQDLDELSQRIMTIEVENSYSSKLLSDGVDPVDENIEHIDALPSGMFKVVYKKEHAAMTGVDAIFIDQYGRICGDPNADDVSPRKKSNTGAKAGVGVSDKKAKEIEDRAAVLIGLHKAKEKAGENSDLTHDAIEEVIRSIQEENSLLQVEVETEAVDEALELEKELDIPIFSFYDEGDHEAADDNEAAVSEGEACVESDEAMEPTAEQHNAFAPIEYHGFEDFVQLLGVEENGRAAFDAILQKCVAGRVVVDREERMLYVEKNFAGEQIKSIVHDHFKGAYDNDLIAGGTSYIYDRDKLNLLIGAIWGASTRFEAYGRGGSRRFFKMLFRSEEVDDLCFLGWYLKIRFENCTDLESLLEKARGATVTVVASDLKTIIERHERLKSITKEFL